MQHATYEEIMNVCILRRSNNLNCLNCEYKGAECIIAHRHAIRCAKELKQIKRKEKENENGAT